MISVTKVAGKNYKKRYQLTSNEVSPPQAVGYHQVRD
jgi:hypothetical protein